MGSSLVPRRGFKLLGAALAMAVCRGRLSEGEFVRATRTMPSRATWCSSARCGRRELVTTEANQTEGFDLDQFAWVDARCRLRD
jgi:hypothetical protein